MKRVFVLVGLIVSALVNSNIANGQNLWTQKNDFAGNARQDEIGFAVDINGDGINDRAFFGSGWDGVSAEFTDFWEYNKATDTWSQKANVPGMPRRAPIGFGIDGKGYIGAGATGFPGTALNDFWEYDPLTNTWAAKANLPSPARWAPLGVSANHKGYFGFGNSGSLSNIQALNDFYEYDPVTDTWQTLSPFAGSGRFALTGFSLDTDGDGIKDMVYIGTGRNGSGVLKDFWGYDISSDTWTRKQDFPGIARETSIAFDINGKGYLGLGTNDIQIERDLYEYFPNTNQWLSIADYPNLNGVRGPQCAVINDTAYVFCGNSGVDTKAVYQYVPFTGFNTIHGNLFVDANSNCQPDTGEMRLSGWLVQAYPGPYFASTDTNGNYSLRVADGNYTVRELASSMQSFLGTVVCPQGTTYQVGFTGFGADTSGFNFGNDVHNCPYLTVNVASTGRRRCFDNLTVAHYCNQGFATAYNVRVYVNLPQYVSLVGADRPFVLDVDSNLVFSIDSVVPGECSDIHIIDHVSCANVEYLGLTACTEAWITPANTCLPPDSNWNGANLNAKATCYSGDTVKLTITNNGTGNMTDSTDYRIYMDSLLVYSGKIELAAGQTYLLYVASGGHTVRIEANQPLNHPFTVVTADWAEGCGLEVPIAVSRGYVTEFPTREGDPQFDVDCITIDGAWDPNDKTVNPQGLASNHLVQPGTPLNYKIRFQNTGTDTAFNITVVDTLSANLDPTTLQITGASHEYTYTVTGHGRPILTFTFANIELPDSNVNLLGSQGFVSFTIKPYNNTPLNTTIFNAADIYFDFNPAVATNQVFTTISNQVDQDLSAHIENGVLVYDGINQLDVPGVGAYIFPNPNNGQFTVRFTQPVNVPTTLTLLDISGRTLWSKEISYTDRQSIGINPGKLDSGIYFLRISTNTANVTLKVAIQ